MIFTILLLIVGFALLIKGADWMVSGSSELARKNKISDLAIGLTIVAFGTSAPEMVVNVVAAIQGHSDIVFGNIIGSNNFNLFIILGISGVITPLVVQSSTVWKEIPFSFVGAIVLLVLVNETFFGHTNMLSKMDAGFLLLLFVGFLYYVYHQLRVDPHVVPEVSIKGYSNLKIWMLILIGIGGLVLGGNLVVNNAVIIAKALGMSEKTIGLTIVAMGTSLPELATSVMAAFRKNNDIAIGNVIGSNIFNILLVLPIAALFHPLQFNLTFNTDLYLLAFGTILLFTAMFTGGKKKLDRWEAAVMLIFYVGYTSWLVVG
ncbi:MAG: calcium/sodium antiporter [Bacteroidales bacterium]|nr:calcium/sodium antiporter [Bacteroidales bacterium]